MQDSVVASPGQILTNKSFSLAKNERAWHESMNLIYLKTCLIVLSYVYFYVIPNVAKGLVSWRSLSGPPCSEPILLRLLRFNKFPPKMSY